LPCLAQTQPTPAQAQAAPQTDAPALPVVIQPGNPDVRYVGRFDFGSPAGPRCAWPASEVSLKFRGTALNAVIGDGSANRWQVEVDGKPTQALQMRGGKHVYRLADGLPTGVHTVDLVKATEALFGTTQFLGFQLSKGASLLTVPMPPHRLEVIGDSISCGYGDEAPNKDAHFSPTTENAAFAYGAVAARALDADYVCIAWSGKKMWPNNTIPELFDRTLPVDAASKWDFAGPAPDVVVINLATNDFWGKPPDEAGWTGAYKAFIARLRTHWPQAQIYCATGPMMYGKSLDVLKSYLTKMAADLNAAGDSRVHLIEFATQDGKNGFGADWHPSLKTHRIMAAQLVSTLHADLGWAVADPQALQTVDPQAPQTDK
jgi:hypothetical protein